MCIAGCCRCCGGLWSLQQYYSLYCCSLWCAVYPGTIAVVETTSTTAAKITGTVRRSRFCHTCTITAAPIPDTTYLDTATVHTVPLLLCHVCCLLLIKPQARVCYHGEGEEMCTQLWEGSWRKPVLYYYISPPRNNPRQYQVIGEGTHR